MMSIKPVLPLTAENHSSSHPSHSLCKTPQTSKPNNQPYTCAGRKYHTHTSPHHAFTPRLIQLRRLPRTRSRSRLDIRPPTQSKSPTQCKSRWLPRGLRYALRPLQQLYPRLQIPLPLPLTRTQPQPPTLHQHKTTILHSRPKHVQTSLKYQSRNLGGPRAIPLRPPHRSGPFPPPLQQERIQQGI